MLHLEEDLRFFLRVPQAKNFVEDELRVIVIWRRECIKFVKMCLTLYKYSSFCTRSYFIGALNNLER